MRIFDYGANRGLLLSLVVLCTGLIVQGGSGLLPYDKLTIKGFKYHDAKLFLTGREALVSGRRIQIRDARAEMTDDAGEKTVISTPSCEFDKVSRRGSGDQAIHLRRRNMTIDGLGFDVDFNRHRIIIRRQVVVRLFDPKIKLLGK